MEGTQVATRMSDSFGTYAIPTYREGPQLYTTGPGLPGPTNVFVPNLESSGRLIIGYSRNVKKFTFPKYVQYVESDRLVGLYMKLSPQEAGRVITTQEFDWPDGQVRPMHEDGLEYFNFVEFRCKRSDFGFNIGWLTHEQAEWDVVEQHSQIHAAQAMTYRTYDGLTTATTASNWTVAGGTDGDLSADHTATASTIVGGYLDQGTSTAPLFKNALDYIADLICQDTLGVVDQDQLHVVFNPKCARLLAASPEIHEFIKGSYWAKEELNRGLGPNNQFGLPTQLYGYDIIVEKCVRVTSRKGATLAKSYAMPNQTMLVLARPGSLEGVYGAKSFSALTYFWHKHELTLQSFSDPRNELTEGHVQQLGTTAVTSPLAGYLVTTAFSS